MKIKKSYLAVAAVGVLAVPAAALARPGHGHGHSPNHGKNHPVAYVFKGTYEGDGVVSVNHGNAHVRHADLIGDVTFDLSAARLSVADTNADTVIDPTDVLVGDHVVVKARLPRQDPTVDPSVAARQLVDQTNPGDDGIDEDTESSDESTDTD